MFEHRLEEFTNRPPDMQNDHNTCPVRPSHGLRDYLDAWPQASQLVDNTQRTSWAANTAIRGWLIRNTREMPQ